MEEVILTGGRVTPGVVRVGDTVRRPASKDHGPARRLLQHLERKGFDGVPRHLGIDEQGREILSFVAGDVPSDLGYYEDAQLSAAASLLRRFHDATADLARTWRPRDEVVCHNDWGPTNTVFRDGMPRCMLDFDTVAPGLRLWDLGYSAFLWLDLGNSDHTGAEQARRLTIFAQAYGLAGHGRAQIAAFAITRQIVLAQKGRSDGNAALAGWATAAASWTAEHLVGRLA